MGILNQLSWSPENPVCRPRTNSEDWPLEQWTESILGKEYIKPVYCYPAYLTYMRSTSCETLDWMTHKLESRLPGEQPQICRWHHSNGWKWRGTKEPLVENERRVWKNWLKTQHSKNENHGIQSHNFMANREGKVETVTNFIFLDSKITADSDSSHRIKRCLLLEKKSWKV